MTRNGSSGPFPPSRQTNPGQSSEIATRLEEAIALHQQGELALAEAAYRTILGRSPSNFDALHLLGVIQLQNGLLESAVDLIGRAIAINPGHPGAHSNKCLALQRLGRLQEALASCERALKIKPDFVDALLNRSVVLQDLGRFEEVIDSCKRVLAVDPASASAHNNRGVALQKLGRLEEALACYERALAIAENYAEAHNNRGDVLQKLRRPGEALASCERALEIRPDYPDALNNSGNALQDLNQPEEALACYDRALAIAPHYAEALSNRGNALHDLNRPGEALDSFRQAIALEPDHVAAHWNESLCLLLMGDFEQGWRAYEWRWREKATPGSGRGFEQPPWLGGPSIAGKTILLHAEQGYGDTLQFCRYAKLVASQGATVVMEVQPPLRPLMEGLQGVDRLLARGEPLPAFDCHCPLMSLPLALGTRVETIPAEIPYLRSDPARVQRWTARLGEKERPRVGVVWSGNPTQQNDHNRSIPLAEFSGLFSDAAQFVSLQKDIHPEDDRRLQAGRILHFGGELKDFADTAALIELMDVVIAVDSSVAHLAGAMGKPTWILLPFASGWRWLMDRDDSPWYPTARLIRQPAIGEWSVVIRRARELALRPLAGQRARAPSPGSGLMAWLERLRRKA